MIRGLCLLFCVFLFNAAAASKKYIILIDAGSSGSRVHVHSYNLNSSGKFPTIDASKNKKIKPGLSSYARNIETGAAALEELIEFAKSHVPQSAWGTTEIHLQATAGLRVLPTAISQSILDACRAKLALSPFKFEPHYVALISGFSEGINGWLAANYLRGVFHNDDKEPYGLIEMGGASMQITYSPKKVSSICPSYSLFILSILGKKYPLYSWSYLDYGLEKAQELFQRLHMENIEMGGNPCYPRNYRHSATGSYAECSKLMDLLLNKNETCTCQSCTFNGISQPDITDENFYAVENFFHTTKFYNVHEEKDFFDDLKVLGEKFCSTPWTDLQKQYSSEHPSQLSKYCFSAAYIPKVLEHGFGLKQDQLLNNVEVVQGVNGVGIDWALGAVIQAILGSQPGLFEISQLAPTLQSIQEMPTINPIISPDIKCTQGGNLLSYFLVASFSSLLMFFLLRYFLRRPAKSCKQCDSVV